MQWNPRPTRRAGLFKYEKNGIAADAISFEDLDYDTLTGFFEWILKERKCSETTRNQRLAALLSFSKYAQNRDFDAAAVFRNSIIRIPLSKPRGKRRTWFTAEEMKILLALPDDRTDIGLRDKMILMTLYVTGARSQELCDGYNLRIYISYCKSRSVGKGVDSDFACFYLV